MQGFARGVSFFVLVAALFSGDASAGIRNVWGDLFKKGLHRLYKIDSDPDTGFVIYRSGSPDADDMRAWCKRGITEVMVLSGNASKFEYKYQKACPSVKVVYNKVQSSKTPLPAKFLAEFDTWVTEARAQGKKILFHCNCGCHRTGRLAAYYRMKFNGWSSAKAIREMNQIGDYMFLHPQLPGQVRALYDHAKNRTCTQASKYCVKPLVLPSTELVAQYGRAPAFSADSAKLMEAGSWEDGAIDQDADEGVSCDQELDPNG